MINFYLQSGESTDLVEIYKYPDGQVGVQVNNSLDLREETCVIHARFNTYASIAATLALNQVLRSRIVSRVILSAPYILGGRSDRRFHPYRSFDLKIVADMINSGGFDFVITTDPHSDVTAALINKCEVMSAWEGWIEQIKFDWSNVTVIAPDAGSYKKLMSLDNPFPYKDKVIGGLKYRDNGVPRVTFAGDVKGKHCAIIDDICDGGRTFTSTALSLKEAGATKVTLFVTHGIFSNGTVLPEVDEIFTTNSYRDFIEIQDTSKFHVHNMFTL